MAFAEKQFARQKILGSTKACIEYRFHTAVNADSTVHSKHSAVHLHHFLRHLHWTCTPLILGKNKKCWLPVHSYWWEDHDCGCMPKQLFQYSLSCKLPLWKSPEGSDFLWQLFQLYGLLPHPSHLWWSMHRLIELPDWIKHTCVLCNVLRIFGLWISCKSTVSTMWNSTGL